MGNFETMPEVNTRRGTGESNHPATTAGESLTDADVWAEAVVANYMEDNVPGQDTYLREHLVQQREGNEVRFEAALTALGYNLASQSFQSYVIRPPRVGEVR